MEARPDDEAAGFAVGKDGDIQAAGHIHRYKDGLFSPASWIAVYTGQRISPQGYDPQADNIDLDMMVKTMTDLRDHIASNVATMPEHYGFVRDYAHASKTTPKVKANV